MSSLINKLSKTREIAQGLITTFEEGFDTANSILDSRYKHIKDFYMQRKLNSIDHDYNIHLWHNPEDADIKALKKEVNEEKEKAKQNGLLYKIKNIDKLKELDAVGEENEENNKLKEMQLMTREQLQEEVEDLKTKLEQVNGLIENKKGGHDNRKLKQDKTSTPSTENTDTVLVTKEDINGMVKDKLKKTLALLAQQGQKTLI